MESISQHKENYKIPLEILDDLASRFIINVPEERNDIIRTCFNMENAHWFYLDFYCREKVMPCGMRKFAFQLFQHVPFLQCHVEKLPEILTDFKQYKMSVPTYGAILMNRDLDKVLLVQSYCAKSSWGFPKGKVNEDEDPIHCAIREVYEETGYDITELINPDMFIEKVFNYQLTRLYIVQNVPTETVFVPRTRMEIKSCEWFNLEHLPTNKADPICKLNNLKLNPNSFFMIMPYVKCLKQFLQEQKAPFADTLAMENHQQRKNMDSGVGNVSTNVNKKRQRHKSLGDLDGIKPLSGASNAFHQNESFLTNATSAVIPSNGTKRNKVKPSLRRQLFTTDATSTGSSDFGAIGQYYFDDNVNPITPQSHGKCSNFKIIKNMQVAQHHILNPKNSSRRKLLVPIDDFINNDPDIDKWKHFKFDLSKLLTF